MTASYYLVGVGGSGSKAVEAYTHLAAAGLGPEETWVAFVDPDQANGNLSRSQATVGRYRKAHGKLRNAKTHSLGSECPLLRTNLVVPRNGGVWSPVPEGVGNAQELFRYAAMTPEARRLMDSLYLPDVEQKMPLDHGFRGRPSLGAAVIVAQSTDSDPFWQDLFQALESAREGRDIRIFMVGSIFGGTGAAGFPVLARLMRRRIEDRIKTQKDSSVRIGGALYLPYFRFPGPIEEDGVVYARSEAFLEQAQAALKYYSNLYSQGDKPFDQLYLLGWPQLIGLDSHATGGDLQQNPPLLPELYGALAALRFFHADGAGVGSPVFSSIGYTHGDSGSDTISWRDLPEVVPTEPATTDTVKHRVAQLLRAAFVYTRIYGPLLDLARVDGIARQAWYRRLVRDAGVDIKGDEAQAVLRATHDYYTEVLRWFATIARKSSAPGLKVNLIDPSSFADNATQADGLVQLHDSLDKVHKQQFSQIVSETSARGLPDIFEELAFMPPPADTQRFGVFHQALYQACRV